MAVLFGILLANVYVIFIILTEKKKHQMLEIYFTAEII